MSDVRHVLDHIVENDAAPQLGVLVLDKPGAGGANHQYRIVFGLGQTPLDLAFQNGPIKEAGVNGITQEVLLAIVIDRLRSFQQGPFSCRENAIALTHCKDALWWLQRRTRERIKRGVEGKSEK